ncbi:MAG: hypothetical protein PW788_02290 [Micavibrio sp.]|nr:hypothetical protein [Micavibrio sp.]
MRRFALASVCALALLGPASSHGQLAQAPQKSAANTILALKAEFNRTAQGRTLLAFAKRTHIGFVVDPALEKTSDLADYNPGYSRLRLRPNLSGEEAVIYAAHELRHGWQDKVLNYADAEIGTMRPRDRWVLRRFLEADAYAYSAYFEAVRMQQLGTDKKDFGEATLEHEVALKLKAQFSSPDGLTLKEYREIAFERFLANLTICDDSHLEMAATHTAALGDRMTAASDFLRKDKLGDAIATLDITNEDIAKTPKPAAFEALLRRMGGMDLDDKAPTSLAAVPLKKLLEDYPFRAEGVDDPQARKDFIQNRLTALDQLYISYLKWDVLLAGTIADKQAAQKQPAAAAAAKPRQMP